MPSDKLKRIATRLNAMQARNEELREHLAGRETEKQQMATRHADAERQLTEQLTQLRNSQRAELTAHEAETTAMKTRRKELKEDYGELKPVFDQLNSAK